MVNRYLRESRLKAGYTQREMSRLIGISLNMYGLMERGKVRGAVDVWLRVKDVLKLTDDVFALAMAEACRLCS